MKRLAIIVIFFLSLLIVMIGISCKSYKEQENELPDTADRGSIHVSADESFKPVVDQLVTVYESQHPGTKIHVTYKPEAECLKDLFVDSVRIVIATRTYTQQEKNFITDSFKLAPRSMIAARDAIAIIVNPRSKDTLFTLQEIKSILQGGFNKNLTPVFDGLNATSTIRFIIDSVLMGKEITKNAMAAKSSEEVINYIARSPGAVGFLGVSWVGDRDDSLQISFLKKVKIAKIESTRRPGVYVLPVQANIYLGRYPLVRDLVYILKEAHNGLGDAFCDFMTAEQGQLIFKRAYLMPGQNLYTSRPVEVVEMK